MLRKGIGWFILANRSLDRCPIWLWMYMRKVRLDQRPIFMMVMFDSPWILSAMAPPALNEWTLTKSGFIPALFSPRMTMDRCIAVIRLVGVTACILFPFQYLHRNNLSVLPCDRIWMTLRARERTGLSSDPKVLWCMVCPMRPFLWFVILRVAESALRRTGRVEERGNIFPSFQNLTLLVQNYFVQVALHKVPFFHFT